MKETFLTRLPFSPGVRRVLENMLWLFFDKIFRIGFGIFVGVWIARHLGPSQYGLWNYAIAFSSLFGAFASLGLDSIVVREIARDDSNRDKLLGSAFFMKLGAGIIMLLLSVATISFVKPGDRLIVLLVVLSSSSFIFQSLCVVDLYFQAHIQSKFSVYAYSGAFIINSLLKLILLVNKAPLIMFAFANVLEIVMSCIFLVALYQHNHLSIRTWHFDSRTAVKLLCDSWPLILAGMSVTIYMRLDQVMIGEFLGDKEVGIYAAAVRISEIWHFIPMAIVSSTLPTLIESKKRSTELYHSRMQYLYDVMAFLALVVAIATTLLGKSIILALFGVEYEKSSDVLVILIWSGFATCLGVASSNWLTVENLQNYSFYRTVAGCIANILLNLYLIPRFGARGAAAATLVSYFISTFFLILWKETRSTAWMMLKSLWIFRAIARLKVNFHELR